MYHGLLEFPNAQIIALDAFPSIDSQTLITYFTGLNNSVIATTGWGVQYAALDHDWNAAFAFTQVRQIQDAVRADGMKFGVLFWGPYSRGPYKNGLLLQGWAYWNQLPNISPDLYAVTLFECGQEGGAYVPECDSTTPESQTGTFTNAVRDFALNFVPAGSLASNATKNGDFSLGTLFWGFFPFSPDDLVFDASAGEMRFYRPAGSTQGVILQETGLSLPQGAAVEIVFRMGNSDTLRKRLSVIVHDADFTDLSLCSFWLDPFQTSLTYTIRAYTTESWSNATISFYAASKNIQGNGAYVLDDVVVRQITGPTDRTECIDPLAPGPGSVAGPNNLINNGDFESGTLSPWAEWAGLVSQVAAGGGNQWLDFFTSTGGAALLQGTGVTFDNNDGMLATFRLGNSSSVRQRVTVILHDSDFSDQSACVFWLAPGSPLRTYYIRAYATKAWNNAMLSLYPATPGSPATHQWLQLDDVEWRRNDAYRPGTICGAPSPPYLGAVLPSGRSLRAIPEIAARRGSAGDLQAHVAPHGSTVVDPGATGRDFPWSSQASPMLSRLDAHPSRAKAPWLNRHVAGIARSFPQQQDR